MATAVDPLRNTLDRLALDPNAQADRPYLVSMLRRLGYSDVEIQAYLASKGADTTLPAATAPASTTADDSADDRLIELEYTGPGLRDFVLITPVDATEFGLDNQDELGLAEGLAAGEEVFQSGPSMEEVDRLVAEGNLTDFDDWGEGAPEDAEPVAIAKQHGEEEGLPPLDSDLETPTELQAAENTGDTLDLPPPEGEAPAAPPGEDFAEGAGAPAPGEMVEFGSGPTEEFVEFGESGPADIDAEGWDQEGLQQAQAWPIQDGGPFEYDGWTLYARDVELPTGKAQRIYFFSKGEPKSGSPSPMPPGYEVGVNDRTGLPYLRRSAEGVETADIPTVSDTNPEPNAPKKRVRIQRVRAASREEAEAKMAAEGRNVIASVPIDIEERWDNP